jgi:ribosomal-protein-alanine N-acetyltransferase
MSTNEVTLREYRAGDLDAMCALDDVCFAQPFRFSRRAMRAFAEARAASVVVADVAGKLTGFCIAHLEEKTGYVVTLDVAPDWRRQGVARRLMEESEARVLLAGGLGMELHVFTGNVGAIRFYEGMGYRRVMTVERFYGRGMDALVYRKRLESH